VSHYLCAPHAELMAEFARAAEVRGIEVIIAVPCAAYLPV